ncbi:transcription termination/antitermination protein NusA, partial [bacterium]|nr:transcription termination/antitermination protein NusA [bacterium]
QQICEEKNISFESVLETIEAALAAAYRKDFGEKNQNVKVNFDVVSQDMDVYDIKTVVEDMDLEELEKQREEYEAKREAGEEIDESEIKRFNPKTEIMLAEAKENKAKAKIGDEIKTKLEVPDEFGRMAAQTAKQVIIQRLREAERENIFAEFKEKEGSIVTAVIQRREGRMVYLDIGHTLAVMNQDGQVMSEKYTSGQRLRVFIVSVEMTPKGPEILVSRTHSDLVKELFKSEVPEISSGIVEIKAIAREAGMRSKIAVSSNQDTIDPVGSCVGQRGTRVQTIITELGGEKIDIIEWHKNPEKFITNALSPAKVESLKLNEKEKTVLVNVKDDQLSLAIGKSGQNVRLAAKLTEWKIDIEGAENIAKEESKEEVEDDKKEKKLDKEEKPVKEKKVKAKTKAKDKKETKPKKKKAAPKKDKK